MDALSRAFSSLWNSADAPPPAPSTTLSKNPEAIAPPAAEIAENTVHLERQDSVPPQPDPSLIFESLLMERDASRSVEVRPGVEVDAARALAEHGDFATFRRRLLWQMIKRKWFGALTERTTAGLGTPAEFVRFVADANDALSAEFRAAPALAPRAAVKLLFKGGNVVTFVKAAAVGMLRAASADGRVADLAAALTSSGLSDVDFYCLLDYEADPALKDPATFEAAHAAAREAAKRALRRVALPASWSSRTRRRFAARGGSSASSRTRSATTASTTRRPSRSSPRSPRPARSRPCPARGAASTSARRRRRRAPLCGESRAAYVSDNASVAVSVEHRDARCVAADDVCAFSLVRLLCGFRVTPARGAAAAALAALRGADASWDEDRDDGSVLCKGEGVDVSFPKRLDVNLALWAEGERDAPGSFVSRATLAAGGRATSILCESLDALILEQRDLTFGKRAQHLVIWRVAKSAKRLRRLVELLGVKLLAAPGFAPRTKAQALRVLHATLAGFCDRSFGRAADKKTRKSAGGGAERGKRTGPADGRQGAAARAPRRAPAARGVDAADRVGLTPRARCDALLRRRSSTRRSCGPWSTSRSAPSATPRTSRCRRTSPPSGTVLAPLVSLVDTFAGAAEALADANATALAEHRLYDFDLGTAWAA
ncbi:hypothetical protein JL720_9115 [Aureococcus anophagefferens]|nr:hypothetical protein JL720_9115 [Aureococcus anophagefferens]